MRRDMRRNLGVIILAVSVADSVLVLGGWFHPLALRWRVHGGLERAVAIVAGSLTFNVVLLATGAVLAFWPLRDHDRKRPESMP